MIFWTMTVVSVSVLKERILSEAANRARQLSISVGKRLSNE
jgi:hypothetical protein